MLELCHLTNHYSLGLDTGFSDSGGRCCHLQSCCESGSTAFSSPFSILDALSLYVDLFGDASS